MPLQFHPRQGALVLVNFDGAFRAPEMVKSRPCVVVSKGMKQRPGLLTVVALSTTRPDPVMPWHREIHIPFAMPDRWAAAKVWVKGDMIYAIGFHRADLFRLGKGPDGRRQYQTEALPPDTLRAVQRCVLEGLGLSALTAGL